MTLTRRNCGRGHTYALDGDKAPGVTRILEMRAHPAFVNAAVKVTANYAVDHWASLSDLLVSERLTAIKGAKQATWGAAAMRGTKLHGYAERLHADEEIPGDELTDEQAALVDSYVAFLDRTGLVVVAAELVVGRRSAPRYCGTADLVCDLPELRAGSEVFPAARWLLDMKSGASGIWPDAALQACAYERAEVYLLGGAEVPLAGLGIERCGAVHVRTDGWDLYPLDTGEVTWETFVRLAWLYEHREAADEWVGAAVDPPRVPLLAGERF